MKLVKCNKCGAVVSVIKDCNCSNCGIKCCNETMEEMIPNSTDAAKEKHIPEYEVIGDAVNIKVNHVMESDHFISKLIVETERNTFVYNLKPGENCSIVANYVPGMKVYSYCNQHGLWMCEID